MTAVAVLRDPARSPAVPVLETGTPPRWVSRRGGDVRAYDVSAAQEVYGPSHRFVLPEDLVVTNGMLRYQVGARNLFPALAVSVFKDGAWRHKGYLWLSQSHTLAWARLRSVTPERAEAVLSVRGEGEVSIELRRGVRGLRVTHGSVLAPSAVADRLVSWQTAAPPALSAGWGYEAWGATPWGGSGSAAPASPGGSPLATGRMYEATVDGGTTRVADAQGLTRGLAVLRSGARKSELGLYRRTRVFEVGAFVATATAGDDLADYHRQLAAASTQTVRLC